MLSKLVKNSTDLDSSIYFEELTEPSINNFQILTIDDDPTYLTPYIDYLEMGKLPDDRLKS